MKNKKVFLSVLTLSSFITPVLLSSCSQSTTTNSNTNNKDENNNSNQNNNNNSSNSGETSKKDVASLVKKGLSIFDLWSLFPEKLQEKNRIVNYQQQDFANNFVSVNSITTKGYGKQMNQFYTIASYVENIITGSKVIFDSASSIADLYQKFIDKNPNNNTYESQTENGNVKFRISLDNNLLTMYLKGGTASVEIETSTKYTNYTCRIQLSNANALKYTITDNNVKIGVKALGAMRLMMDMDKSNKNQTIAKLYNFYGKSSSSGESDEGDGSSNSQLGITTSSVLYVDNNYTSIIGKKGDFIRPSKENRNMEVYSNTTGDYVGSKVFEKGIILKDYFTNWYPIQSLLGIVNIKKSSDKNEFYLNSSNMKFSVSRENFTKTRKYDFENKKIYLYKIKEENSSNNIDKYSVTIPMFFIQDEFDNLTEYNNLNRNNHLNISNQTFSSLRLWITNTFINMNIIYNNFNEKTDTSTVNAFIGNQNSWLN